MDEDYFLPVLVLSAVLFTFIIEGLQESLQEIPVMTLIIRLREHQARKKMFLLIKNMYLY